MSKVSHFTKDQKIAAIGAGPAGIHMASQLKKRGYTNVTILEKSGMIGGTRTCARDSLPIGERGVRVSPRSGDTLN